MNLHEVPYKVMINMPQASDRRWQLHEKLCKFGFMDVACEHPIPIAEIDRSEYSHLPEEALPYISQIITIKRVLTEAKRRGAKSTWLLEDDATFHSEFNDRVRRLRVPNNWCFLYLGGAYYEEAIRINGALVRPDKILDLHSLVISSEVYDVAISQLDAVLKDTSKSEVFADVTFASLHKKYPAYLCRPNLVWQAPHHSDLKGKHYSNYAPDGEQWHKPTELPLSAVFTFWTKNGSAWAGWKNKEQLIECFVRSSYFAQSCVSRTVLYTDAVGKELLKGAYFDDIYMTLDALDVSPTINCAAKLDTLTRQTESFVHLDPDILLRKTLTATDFDVIVSPCKVPAKDQLVAANLLRNLEWTPEFVKDILGDRRNVEVNSLGMLGGKDVKFLRWYGETGLEILRKQENIHSFEKADDRTNTSLSNAIESWLLDICATYRGKQFKCIPENLTYTRAARGDGGRAIQNGSVKPRASKKQSTPLKPAGDSVNMETGFRPVPSSTYIQYVKHGHGWFIDIHRIAYKVVLAVAQDSGKRCVESLYSNLGIKCDLQLRRNDKNKRKGTKDSVKSHLPEEERRLTLLEICAEAKRRKVEYIAIFQEGVEFDANILNLLYRIKVPYDWQFIYIGGNSSGEEEWVGRGVTKSDFVLGLDALILQIDAIIQVEQKLSKPFSKGESCETRIAQLHKTLPTYICRPELIRKPEPATAESVR